MNRAAPILNKFKKIDSLVKKVDFELTFLIKN
jgi:hypothetical protein